MEERIGDVVADREDEKVWCDLKKNYMGSYMMKLPDTVPNKSSEKKKARENHFSHVELRREF